MNYTFENRKDVYTDLWARMDITPSRYNLVARQAERISANKDRYAAIQVLTNVPWYVIGLMHLRESNLNFATHLHNGDPLTKRTTHVPAGRPIKGVPPFTFEESAVDALLQKGYNTITDWSIERIAFVLERYNGFGYVSRGINSPYLWASTNNYTRGKYIRDGVFSASTIDTQLGTMAILKVILEKESIEPVPTKSHTEVAIEAPKAEPVRPTTKELSKVSRKAWWTRLGQWLGLGGGTATIAGKAAQMADLSAAKSTLDGIKAIWTEYGAEIAIIVCTAIVCLTVLLLKYQKDDIQEGRAIASGSAE